MYFLEQDGEGGGEGRRQLFVVEDFTGLTFSIDRALGDGEAELAKEATKRIDTSGAGFLPLFAHAVKLLALLLVDGANGDWLDALAAVRFEQGLGIDAV